MNNSNPLFQPLPEGNYKIGIRYGALIMMAGAVITGINFILFFTSDYYFPKLLLAGIALLLLGPVFMIFPGKPLAEKPAVKDMARMLMSNSSTAHKIAWIVWGIISVGLAFYFMTQLDPDFWK